MVNDTHSPLAIFQVSVRKTCGEREVCRPFHQRFGLPRANLSRVESMDRKYSIDGREILVSYHSPCG